MRGFAISGFGPRDLTCQTANGVGANCDPLGGTMYWGATAELQTPLFFLPKDIGIKMAGFVDAGSLWDYVGPTRWQRQTMFLGDSNNGAPVRASAGIGFLWDSPIGLLRFDFAFPFLKEPFDRTQWFRFSGGTSSDRLVRPGTDLGMSDPVFFKRGPGLFPCRVLELTGARPARAQRAI